MKFMQTLARCALVVLVSTSALFAQTVTGTVAGTVSDQSGAVIPGANVVAHNMGTGVSSSATSDSSGVYRIGFLPIGPYQVTVEAQGFGTQTLPVFQLEALQTATFNVKLATGSVSTTVSVSEATPILNTNDATLSSTFTANTIQNFPLNGARFFGSDPLRARLSEYGGNIRHYQHRAQHFLHRFGELERKSSPGKQLHPGWDRYE